MMSNGGEAAAIALRISGFVPIDVVVTSGSGRNLDVKYFLA
ncbi:hypothetical protein Lepto7376_2562 [[Leptolyngbya] sp. PCC 7376]|nr:hypothetical protein [[Leptolyngbya] sp. PCC 7376]AFY38835.1 hypothetical protein Lepto7376_2562 [[Leptolyngbya] sp. PCC 7376]